MNIRPGSAGTFTKGGRMAGSMADVVCVVDMHKGSSFGLFLICPVLSGSRRVLRGHRRRRR